MALLLSLNEFDTLVALLLSLNEFDTLVALLLSLLHWWLYCCLCYTGGFIAVFE